MIATAAAIDLRVNADHLAFHVKQRTAGVARIDGDISLQERHVGFVRQLARFCADDSRRDGVVESKRRADGDHPLAHFGFARIAELDNGQLRGIDFQQRHIGFAIVANDLRFELTLVGELHRHFGRLRNNVGIGQQITIGGNNKTGTDTAALGRRAGISRLWNTEAFKEVRHLGRHVLSCHIVHLCCDADVHHRRALRFHQRYKIR